MKQKYNQIQPPEPQEAKSDNHARLILDGRPINAGDSFTALFPDGWKEVTIEMRWTDNSPDCWYIAYPKEKQHEKLLGLFARW